MKMNFSVPARKAPELVHGFEISRGQIGTLLERIEYFDSLILGPNGGRYTSSAENFRREKQTCGVVIEGNVGDPLSLPMKLV